MMAGRPRAGRLAAVRRVVARYRWVALFLAGVAAILSQVPAPR